MREPNRQGFKYFSVVNNVSDNLTCVEFIRCSPERMIPITDKRITYSGRFVDTASKLNTKGPYAVMGTGDLANIVGIEEKWAQIPIIRDLNEELNSFKEEAFYKTYLEKLEDGLVKRYGIKLSELQSGLKNGVPLSGKVMDDAMFSVRNFTRWDIPPTEPAFRTQMLFGGYDQKSKEMKMYIVQPPSVVDNLGQPFNILGSGSDLGAPVLGRHFSLLPSHQRDNISLGDGLYVGLEAMIRGEGNIGVGGTEIGLMEKDKDVIKFSEDVCGVMRNTVEKSLMGEIEKEKAKSLLEKLANKEVNPDDAAKEISNPLDVKNYIFSR